MENTLICMNDFVFELHALNTLKEIIKLVYKTLIKMYVSFGINKCNIAIFYEKKKKYIGKKSEFGPGHELII